MARQRAQQQVIDPKMPIPINNLGVIGIVKDRPGHTLPPEAWTDGNNIRFQNRNVRRILGHMQVYGAPLAAPDWIFDVPGGSGTTFWLYGTQTNAYVWDGAHHTITRGAGVYGAVNQWDWNFCILGGIPILNNNFDVPQYWPALSSGTLLANLTAWGTVGGSTPATTAKIIKNFGLYLVAMNITIGGVNNPHMVWWSAQALPGSLPVTWDYTDPTHDAGQTFLTDVEGGEILSGLMLGNFFVIYKRMSTQIMSFVGGQDTMAFQMLFPTSGVLTPRSVCTIDKGMKHFVVTQDDAITHLGYSLSAQSVLQERERDFLFGDMDPTNLVSAFAFDNLSQFEAWFCYPSSGNVIPNKVMIYNYRFNTIQFRDFNGLYADLGLVNSQVLRTWTTANGLQWSSDTGPWQLAGGRGIVFSSPHQAAGLLYQLDSGYAFDQVAPVAFVERQGLAIIGRDRTGQPIVDYHHRKQISRVWPKVVGTSILAIKVGAQEQTNGPITWGPTVNFNPQTQFFVDTGDPNTGFMPSGRLNAINFTSTDNNAWELQGYDIDVSVLGEM